ncbi:MAG: zinc ribbon domain-containing protein [Bacteroidota bacterium]
MYCKNCGNQVNEKAIACTQCGCNPQIGTSYCKECGASTKERQLVCINCGVSLKHSNKKDNAKSLVFFKNNDYLLPVISLLISVLSFLLWNKEGQISFFVLECVFIAYPVYYTFKKYKSIFGMLIIALFIYIIRFVNTFLLAYSKEAGNEGGIKDALVYEIHNSIVVALPIFAGIVLLIIIFGIINQVYLQKGQYANAKKLNFVKRGVLISTIFLIVPLSIFLYINLSKLHKISDTKKQELISPYQKLQKEWKVVKKDNAAIVYDLVILEPGINTDDYGRIRINQTLNLYINSKQNNYSFDYQNEYEKYKFSYPIIYNFNSDYNFVIDTLKQDSIFGHANFSTGIFNFYAVAADKYISCAKDTSSTSAKESSSFNFKIILENNYRAIERKNFDASDYFTSSVDLYITMKNTTPAKINANIQSSFYKEFIEPKYLIETDSYSEVKLNNGETKVAYIEKLSSFRKSKQKNQVLRTKIEVIFTNTNKIRYWKQLEIIQNTYND